MRNSIVKFAFLIVCILWIIPLCSSAQTVGSEMKQQLHQAGIKNADKIVESVEKQLGTSLNVPLYDRVDFASFPDARLNVQKLKAPAVLILSPQLTNYIFKGKPNSFQGSFRTYEFHLGIGIHKASSMLFPQVFEQIRGLSGPNGLSPNEVAIVPRLEEFKFEWGGVFTPVMYVTLKISVGIFSQGKQIFHKTYGVENVKEGTSTIFPNESQEYKAISKAMLSVLKQAGQEIANLPVLLAYKEPAAPVVVATVPANKIDIDAIIFLADTWKKYHENKDRLTLEERRIAVRILRLKDAWSENDIDKQQDEILKLVNISKNLEPVSRKELIDEIKFHKEYTDKEVTERNESEDNLYNFAGDSTETVLDYAGLGIDLAKVGVLATGCIISTGVTCPALALTMAQFDMAETVAEGVGAASEELIWKSGDVSTAVYQGTKASLIYYIAQKTGGGIADKTVGKLATKVSQETAASAVKRVKKIVDVGPGLTNKIYDNVYVTTMELTYRAPVAAVSAVVKDRSKSLAADVENLMTKKKATPKTIKQSAPTGKTKEKSLNFDSLNKL